MARRQPIFDPRQRYPRAGRFDGSGALNLGGCPDPRPWAAYGRLSARFGRWYYRYRWELAPVTWAAVTAAAGVVAAELLSTSTIVLVAAAAWAGTALAVRRWKSARYRTHAHAAALAAGGWATAVSVWGADNQWVAAGLAAATAAVGIPWWVNHAVRDHIEQVRERERWPEIAAQLQMVGSKMLRRTKLTDAATGREIGWEVLIQLRPGDTASTLAAKRTQLESLWGLRIGSVQVGKVVENARRATVTVVDTDVFAMKGDITHPALTDGWEPGSRTSTDPIPVGICEDGTIASRQLVDESIGALHGLTMGKTGSGKSTLANSMLAAAAASSDVVIWYGETAKAGGKGEAWRGCLDMFADTEDKVLAMLQAGAAVVAARGAYAREKYKDDAIPPGDGVPMLYILLDEFATTCKGPKGVEILDAATKISQTGRSVLVGVDIYTQHGASGAFGASSATQLIAQCGTRGCFRLEKNEHARFVFPSSYSQIDTSALPLDGTFYLSTRGDELPTKQRAYALYKPADVRRIADRLSAGTRPRLDEPSATAAAHVLGTQYPNTTNHADDQHEEPAPPLVRTGPRTLAPPPKPMSADEEQRVRVDIEAARARITAATDTAFRRADATRAATGGTGYLSGNTTTLPTPRPAVEVDDRPRDESHDAQDDLDRRILDILTKAAGIPVSSTSIQANFRADVSASTVKRRLTALQDAGLVRMVGAGRGAGWTLPQ